MFAAEWKRIATGNGEIDVAHAELTAIAAALDESCQHGDYESVSDDDIKRLFEIATRLFGLEKSAMEEIDYKKIFEHIEDHELLEEMIISARRQISSKFKALIKDAMEPLSFSIIGHIETMDVPLAEAISFKSRKPALSHHRSSDTGHNTLPARHSPSGCGAAKLQSGHASQSDGASSFNAIIINSYSSALLDLKESKWITGDRAKTVAYEIVARLISSATGKNIKADYVKKVILSQ